MWHDHHHQHWIGIAIVAALALVAFEAMGQGTGAQAMFEGRPALAGAQAGLGAQAGPPQGGIGLQGSQGAQLHARRPHVIDQLVELPRLQCGVPSTPSTHAVPADEPLCLPPAFDERRERRLAMLGIDAQARRAP